MDKICLVIGLIIAVGAMLVIPSPVAKASTCSASTSGGSTSGTTSGSCSIGATTNHKVSVITDPKGGSQSSCTSVSASQGSSPNFSRQSSNGAVSCSSHSP